MSAKRVVIWLASAFAGFVAGTAGIVVWYTLLLDKSKRIPSQWEFLLELDDEDEDDYEDDDTY